MSPHRVNQIETGVRRRAEGLLRINCSRFGQICRPSRHPLCRHPRESGDPVVRLGPRFRGDDEKKRRIYGSWFT
jgi:hypothetical protein